MSEPVKARGIILRTDSDQLIVQASQADVAQFSRQTPVFVHQQRMGMSYDAAEAIMHSVELGPAFQPGQYLYDNHGRRLGVVMEVDVTMTSEAIEITTFGDGYRTFSPGRRTLFYTLKAHGIL